MNGKTERVSAERLVAVAEKNYENITEVEWDGGIVIKVKANLSLSEVASFVAIVTDYCFGEDGEYHPEFMDFAMQTGIATIYGNLDLPESIEDQYTILCTTGVCDHIMQYVNKAQFKELVKAIDRKLKYLTDSNINEVRGEIDKFTDAIIELRNRMELSMENFQNIDIEGIANRIAGFDIEGAIRRAVAPKEDEKGVTVEADDK